MHGISPSIARAEPFFFSSLSSRVFRKVITERMRRTGGMSGTRDFLNLAAMFQFYVFIEDYTRAVKGKKKSYMFMWAVSGKEISVALLCSFTCMQFPLTL
jgi:hypothetical protein